MAEARRTRWKTVEIVTPFAVGQVAHVCVKRPHFDLGHFERVEHVHGDRVGALVGQMPSDPLPQAFAGLADIDWFTVIIVERIDTVF